MSHSYYPLARMRRTRGAAWSRALVRETDLSPRDLIQAAFVQPGPAPREPVASMPGVDRLSVEALSEMAQAAEAAGIPALAFFPQIDPALKDPVGSEALNPDGLVCRAIRAVKKAAPGIGLMVDVALDPFTSHGHDGVLGEDGMVANDETVERLVRQALVQAEAGADIIAPSDMMDGRVKAIREALEAAGHHEVLILSYAAKFASAFYGPFRDAIGSSGALKGDKRAYQMDPANAREALRECALDVAEGADMLLVKPGLPYLDILWRVKEAFGLPTFAFQVSGEYAMIKAAGANGWLDERKAMLETLTAFKRAGADGVVTYFALEAARALTDRA